MLYFITDSSYHVYVNYEASFYILLPDRLLKRNQLLSSDCAQVQYKSISSS